VANSFVLKPQFGAPMSEVLRETTRLANLVDEIKQLALGTN
jgi:hypothetical protein